MTELSEKYQTNSDPFLYGIPSIQKSFKFKKSPNCPLKKGPFIRVKVECKNLEILVKSTSINETNNNSITNFTSSNDSFKKPLFTRSPEFNINPMMKIYLNEQVYNLDPIYHNNPKWLSSYELDIKNYKIDKIFFEVFNSVKLEKKIFSEHENENLTTEEFIGFQLLPMKYLEKHNLSGSEKQIVLRLIDKKPSEYFVEDDRHVLNVENHDPSNYKLEDSITSDNNDIKIPLIKIKYEYINFSQLWFITATVHSIIQKDDPLNKGKTIYSYKLYIRRNDDCEWYKECSFEEIEKFRNNLIKCFPNVKNIPFPSKSILSYVPFLNKIYGDENNDILIEKKYVLDNFFNEICEYNQSYKVEEFNKFFSED